ncbi:PLP-dependent aminotransferase family protein [Conexibacter woesei]|uniref:MocR-like pyridoxine biosynthesis transcription factor PdxR n=1 Tax=Conexibacter woesei TaxID=191495 RepID=UPI0004081A02|nr:PLP-dependent aminotransferase family protein [Conexibacter woesei]
MDLHLDLDTAPGRSLRARAEHALRDAVRSGRLAPGTRLPATRALATELGVSRGVVVEAYAQLAAEGYLDTRRGGGTRVAAGGATAADQPRPLPGDRPLHRSRAGGSGEMDGLLYDMRPSLPSTDGFPRQAWLQALTRVLRTLPDERLGYGDRRGEQELRTALVGWLARRRGVVAGPEQVLITGGLRDALPLVWRMLRARGARRVAVEDPGWWRIARSAEAAGLEAVPTPTDDDGLRPDRLRDVDVVAVTPAHQFPTGAVLHPERRAALVAYARAHGAYLLEDDYDAEFRYDRQPIGSIQGLAPDLTIHAGSASKSLAPALRLGWLVLPSGLTAELQDDDPASPAGTPPTLDQLALADLIERGEVDRHLRRQRLRYAKRRAALLAQLEEQLPALQVRGAAAGLFAVLALPPGAHEDDIAQRAAHEGVACEPLRAPGRTGLVLGYANLPEPSAPHAVRALVRALARTP